MDNSHKTVGYDSNSNLDADGILCGVLKPLDLKMSFQPFEEEFNQPSFLVKFCNFKSREMLGVGDKSELAVIFFIVVANEPE